MHNNAWIERARPEVPASQHAGADLPDARYASNARACTHTELMIAGIDGMIETIKLRIAPRKCREIDQRQELSGDLLRGADFGNLRFSAAYL